MSKSMFERGLSATARYFEPINEVVASHQAPKQAAKVESPLTDYERYILAMHEYFPESMEYVQQIGESVEVGSITEERAIFLIEKLAAWAICGDIEKQTEACKFD